MEMKLSKTRPGKLCRIRVDQTEALALIKSLVSQIQGGPNNERLESSCTGDATWLFIAVHEKSAFSDLTSANCVL